MITIHKINPTYIPFEPATGEFYRTVPTNYVIVQTYCVRCYVVQNQELLMHMLNDTGISTEVTAVRKISDVVI